MIEPAAAGSAAMAGVEKGGAARGQGGMDEDSEHLDIPAFVGMTSAPRAPDAKARGRRTARGSSSESSPATSADSSPAASPRGIPEDDLADLAARSGCPRPRCMRVALEANSFLFCEHSRLRALAPRIA
jgi:hypothetical protein